jgi:hypothetical protein
MRYGCLLLSSKRCERATVLTETQLKKLVKRKNWGDWIEYHHHSLADADLYEIWTTTDGDAKAIFWLEDQKGEKFKVTPQTRFVFESEDGSEQHFDYFVNLIRYLHKRFLSAARHGAELELAITRETEALANKRFALRVAGFAFLLAATALVIGILIHGDRVFTNGYTIVLAVVAVTGLVSSGAIAFFGVWRPIALPKSVADLVAAETETHPSS